MHLLGFTVPEIDKVLEPYAEKSYRKYKREYQTIAAGIKGEEMPDKYAHDYAMKKVKRDFEQGFQGLEYKLNTVGSSRGDYPFVTITFGLATSQLGKMASIAALQVHREGQGKEGYKKPVLFPKLVFLYDEELHGEGKELEDVFEEAIKTSGKTMYPDYLSLSGEGYVPSMYKKYKRVVSPMGCRAFLSPWYERGGISPADDEDKPVFVGRWNGGAITLNLPMIYAKAKRDDEDFHDVLDYYLEMIRNLHRRTYEYLAEIKASVNPVAFCEGGFYMGHLKPEDKIRPLLPYVTFSFGYTALNELQILYNGKSIAEDGMFALETMEYINEKVSAFKEQDGILYAHYGAPGESLCLAGKTLVQTYEKPCFIEDLKTGDLVYTLDVDTNKIELKPITFAGKTGTNRKVVKVTFDNGQEIICTPDHMFGVRKRNPDHSEHVEFVLAGMLQKGMRIKSNYIKTNCHGRPEFSIYYNGKKQLVQNVNAEYFYGPKPEKYVVHHKDENKENNSAENLVYMSDADHRRLHLKDTIAPHYYTSEGMMGKKNTFYGKHHTPEARKKNREKHLGRKVAKCDMDGNILEVFECIQDVKQSGYVEHLVRLACRGERKVTEKNPDSHAYVGFLWNYLDTNEDNHVVVSVEELAEPMDVYDIKVEGNHNFFVGGNEGILVHNCSLQPIQFRQEFGIVHNVSDRPYVSNSFHCHVTEDITPIEKQDLENRFWNTMNGGKIQYVRYPIDYNLEAIKTLVRRAMKMGFYEGVNLSLAYCEDCGHQEVDMDVCPICGSSNLTKIDRMNGYLAYSRVHGDTRLNAGKMAEIADRKSM